MKIPTFYKGQEVETRKGKRGTVVESVYSGETEVDVRFGSKVFRMRVTQLASARSLDKARSYRTPDYGRRG